MPNRRVLTLEVLPAWEGRTVKNLLLRQLHMSEGLIARVKLRERGICRNGAPCRTTDRVSAGDVLTAERTMEAYSIQELIGKLPCGFTALNNEKTLKP